MGELINNFLLSLPDTISSYSTFSAILVYGFLGLFLWACEKKWDDDSCLFLIIFQIILNIAHVAIVLPESLLFVTKIIVFLAPYLLAFIVVWYVGNIQKRKKDE